MRHLRSYRASRAGDLIGFTRRGPIFLAAGGDPTATDPTTTTTDPATDGPEPYAFPFPVPADFADASDEELRALLASVRDHAAPFAALTPSEHNADSVRALQACAELATDVKTVINARRENGTQASAASAALMEAFGVLDDPATPATDPDPDPEPTPDPEPQPTTDPASAVTAATGGGTGSAPVRRTPPVSTVARRAPAAQLPENADRPLATMVAAADVPGFATGQPLTSFADAAAAVAARLERYPTASRSTQSQRTPGKSVRPVESYDPDTYETGRLLPLRNFARHGAVQIRREFPDDLRLSENGGDAYEALLRITRESRLPGGNLVRSMAAQVKAGRSLTAAAGWCAPSEVIYDLIELETLDGILDLPEAQASRGGFQIPQNGGPNFRTIYTGIGNSGDTHLTEAEVIADTAKVCTDIPCPTFTDVRLGVDYVCLTGGLLQRRGYPEMVARFSRGAITALAHKINQGIIADMVSGSGAAVVIPADANGDDAISGILYAVDIAVTDIKYQNRMGFNATVEVVLPMWVLTNMRAAASRRRGVDMVSLADAEIMAWFAQRNAVPRFVYDWQDGFSGLASSPGGAAAITAMPQTVQFLAYPAGTWVKAVQDVVSLDTIYDSTKLTTNEYTALFAEDGWAMLKMGPTSRLYTAIADTSGVVGCCPTEIS